MYLEKPEACTHVPGCVHSQPTYCDIYVIWMPTGSLTIPAIWPDENCCCPVTVNGETVPAPVNRAASGAVPVLLPITMSDGRASGRFMTEWTETPTDWGVANI